MSSKIPSQSELEIRLASLETTVSFLKRHKIGERSKQGELLSQLHDELVNAFVSYYENKKN
ncbi:hypothetical protein [Leuconostoc lactis]|uniref:hypothetical protein n=1 Tax=Leuconostoc lactis TaxID=1246 RepID=UPI0028A13EAD|nr:hypothetical protein [Leuconostoc lactis]